jgi:hypothetical protein
MGWMFVMGPCYGCGVIFCFNADLVPSLWVKGQREPVCAECVARANPTRVANGLDPIAVLDGAYEPGQE